MKQLTIGARITDDGIEFFGTDEVNALIAEGLQISGIEPGETLMEEVPDEEDAYAVAGFEMIVTFANTTASG